MSLEEITLIIPLRNREAYRVRRLVASLRENGADPSIVLVDYGSRPEFATSYAAVALELGLEIEPMLARGLPWNKCKAINRGVRLSSSQVVCMADVDMAFSTDPISAALTMGTAKRMFHVQAYWLPKNGSLTKARPGGLGAPGGFQLVERSAYNELGGYDEDIQYWGLEDLDWPDRLKTIGYEQVWLPEPHRLYHLWHEPSEAGRLRPETASFETMKHCVANKLKPRLKQDWGKPLGIADRPILKMIASPEKAISVHLEPNALMHYGTLHAITESRVSGSFVRLDLGTRMIRRPFCHFRDEAKAIMRPLAAMTGNSVVDKLNCNFDYLYAMLPALLENGLIDYYIDDTLEFVFLFWG